MGLTFNLGRVSPSVFTDSSLNVGIGAAPSGTYKFEVTGTAKVSGILTLGSTISNGTYTYTLPSATGTLALTSALGDYLPLAGGTLTGALSGTSATFSGTFEAGRTGGAVTAGDLSVDTTSASAKVIIGRLSSISADNTTLIGRNRIGTQVWSIDGGGIAVFNGTVTATSNTSQFKEGFIIKATTTSGAGSQPAYTYYTAAGSKRWSSFLDVGSDKFHIANASNTEVFTIQQNGNVGINKIDPATTLNVVGGTSGSSGRLRLTHSTSGSQIDLYVGVSDGTGIIVNNNPLFFEVNGTERMRIRSDGEVLMHSTTFNSANDGQLFGTGGDTYFTVAGATVLYLNRRTTNGVIIDFRFNNTSVGSISTNSNSLPSDRNFKKNITDISIGLDLVTKLKPVHYRHKFDEDNEPLSNGIIAQELEEALLECGIEKNSLLMLQYKPNEKEGESQYWVDYTKMIPVLVKAIQELSAQNQDLKSRLDKAGL